MALAPFRGVAYVQQNNPAGSYVELAASVEVQAAFDARFGFPDGTFGRSPGPVYPYGFSGTLSGTTSARPPWSTSADPPIGSIVIPKDGTYESCFDVSILLGTPFSSNTFTWDAGTFTCEIRQNGTAILNYVENVPAHTSGGGVGLVRFPSFTNIGGIRWPSEFIQYTAVAGDEITFHITPSDFNVQNLTNPADPNVGVYTNGMYMGTLWLTESGSDPDDEEAGDCLLADHIFIAFDSNPTTFDVYSPTQEYLRTIDISAHVTTDALIFDFAQHLNRIYLVANDPNIPQFWVLEYNKDLGFVRDTGIVIDGGDALQNPDGYADSIINNVVRLDLNWDGDIYLGLDTRNRVWKFTNGGVFDTTYQPPGDISDAAHTLRLDPTDNCKLILHHNDIVPDGTINRYNVCTDVNIDTTTVDPHTGASRQDISCVGNFYYLEGTGTGPFPLIVRDNTWTEVYRDDLPIPSGLEALQSVTVNGDETFVWIIAIVTGTGDYVIYQVDLSTNTVSIAPVTVSDSQVEAQLSYKCCLTIPPPPEPSDHRFFVTVTVIGAN